MVFRWKKSRVVDENVNVGAEEVGGLFSKVVAGQGALGDPSELSSCVLAP